MSATVNAMFDSIYPPPLKPGDTIGVLAPAGPVRDQQAFSDGVGILRDRGFQVRMANDIMRSENYLAGSEERRAAEFHDLFRDPEIKGILAVRGGYGSLRLLPHLDLDLIRHNPKILIGFSDVSVLLNAIHAKTGLIGFHGPNLCSLSRLKKSSIELFFSTITRQQPDDIQPAGLEVIKSGNATGFLMGGNLASLTHMIGTPFEPNWNGAVLFLEDINEAPYRLDRMLTQIALSGRLDHVKGIILGEFTGCGDVEMVWNRVLELIQAKDIPVWGNFPLGHGQNNWLLPIGINVAMNSDNAGLHFLK